MPELPEVETMCRGIRQLVGRRIIAVQQPTCRYRPIAIRPAVSRIDRQLRNRKISAISRLGKRVLIHAGEWVLILQPKMAGLVSLDRAPNSQHVRLQVQFSGRPKTQLIYWDRRGLGTVELMKDSEIQTRLIDGRLGPDALDISLEEFIIRLRSTRRQIKVALLDQKLVAGIGNLYASEMLHRARIHPARGSDTVSSAKLKVLYEAMRGTLLKAIEHEGSTLADGTYRNALNNPGTYQNQHLVYDRAGLPCPTCAKSAIRRIVQAQRSSFFCPRCQKLPNG